MFAGLVAMGWPARLRVNIQPYLRFDLAVSLKCVITMNNNELQKYKEMEGSIFILM